MIEMKAMMNAVENQKKYRYLLLDMLGETSEFSPLYLSKLREMGAPYLRTIEHPGFKRQPDNCPQLVCLGLPSEETNQRLLEASFQEMNDDYGVSKRYFCAWIMSDKNPIDLEAELLSIGRLLGSLAEERFIAFYEPFRMELLAYIYRKLGRNSSELVLQGTQYYYPTQQQRIDKMIGSSPDVEVLIDYSEEDADEIARLQKASFALLGIYQKWLDVTNKSPALNAAEDDLDRLIGFYARAKLLFLLHPEDRNIYLLFSMLEGDLVEKGEYREALRMAARLQSGTLSSDIREIRSR